MTNTQRGAAMTEQSFEVKKRKVKRAAAEFTLADDPEVLLTAYKPKAAILLPIASLLNNAKHDELAEAQAIDMFLDMVLAAESRDYIKGRLNDPEDDLDVDDLTPIIEWLQGQWSERPTGSRAGSSPRSRTNGKRSTDHAR